MEIRTFGVGGRIRECERLLCESLRDLSGRLILLPIPTSRDNIYITGSSTETEEILPLIREGDAIVGYNIPAALRQRAEQVGAPLYDGALDEAFLCANADLTARGTLGYLLTHSESDLADLSVGVVGYGRIGIRLIRLLLLFDTRLTVYTTRQSVALELCEMGISATVIGEDSDFSGLDILINTAPARQIDESRLPTDLETIDLASGSIFEPSERLVKLASIPDIMYPKTAGRLYAEAAIRELRGEKL